ncbi:MAG: LacI family DNA-binding transcriptional regulator [Lachnospiraceae bacterium]|nr:LacI family DNA-binding transcriptional regulator [Lachnospiraceae bacterium]
MKDVAEEAGVSLGTVSKVINGKPVGEEYVRKVNEAIRKLNYHVNSYAQGLKASRTYTVAVLMPNTYHPFYAMLTYWLNASLTRRGYRMLLCCTDSDPRQEQEYVYMAQQNKVDGIIGLTYNDQLQVSEDTPFVSIDRPFNPQIPCVASDNFAGGQMAAEKLADLGCRKVLFLRTGSSLNNEPNKRKAGFENGCIARGLSYEMKILSDGEWLTEEDIEEQFRAFLASRIHDGKPDFDGIFCVTDSLAFIVRRMLEEMGLRVPEDVQLIGFDGTRWLAHMESSGYMCSTIVQPIESIAEMSVDLLLENSMSIKPPLVCLPVTFAEGGTTRQ